MLMDIVNFLCYKKTKREMLMDMWQEKHNESRYWNIMDNN